MTPYQGSQATAAYNAEHASVTKGLYSYKIHKDTMSWCQWDSFCCWLQITPNLWGIKLFVPFLHIFSHKVHTWVLSVKLKTIQKQSVEQYIRSVCQILAAVGSPDPLLNTVGSINFCLGRQIVAYRREDPPPPRFHPLPISILSTLYTTYWGGNNRQQSINNLACIEFFFILWLGEYWKVRTDTVLTPFRVKDIQFFVIT